MAVSMEDVRRVLDPEEPNYEAAAKLGTEALPHLQALVAGKDSMLASKAAYAASMLQGAAGEDVVRTAARSHDLVVRVAAAAAARNLPPEAASDVLAELVDDEDPGISKVARASATHGGRAR
jgi:HEAT repeat protein